MALWLYFYMFRHLSVISEQRVCSKMRYPKMSLFPLRPGRRIVVFVSMMVFDTIQHTFKTTNSARLRHSNNKLIHFVFSAADIVTSKVHSHRSVEKNHFYSH